MRYGMSIFALQNRMMVLLYKCQDHQFCKSDKVICLKFDLFENSMHLQQIRMKLLVKAKGCPDIIAHENIAKLS